MALIKGGDPAAAIAAAVAAAREEVMTMMQAQLDEAEEANDTLVHYVLC